RFISDPSVEFAIGDYYLNQSNFGLARVYFDSALRNGASSAKVAKSLRRIPLNEILGDLDNLGRYEEHWNADRDNIDWTLLLTDIYLARNREDERAIQVYRKAIPVASDSKPLHILSARDHLSNSRPEDAFADIDAVLTADPRNREALDLL